MKTEKIKRYDCDRDGEEYETTNGPYVRFEDYQALQKELQAARDRNDHLQSALIVSERWRASAESRGVVKKD